MQEHLIADDLLVVHLGPGRDRVTDHRVGVVAADLVLRVPRHVIDARAGVGDLVHRCADPLREHFRGALYTVAQARELNAGLALHRAAEHRHRVRVIEHRRVRAEALHVASDVEHHRDGPQCAENTGRAARVTHVGVHAILLRDLNVVTPDVHPLGENGDTHDIRAA